jgi:pyrimidine-nucleoside phosphorylase
MNFVALIEAKRDGQSLPPDIIRQMILEFTRGQIPDYQMSAWLMAVQFRGLDTAETRALTLAMRDSGERLNFPADPRPLVDKHSTGGVGDKVSLALAPLLACLGFRVPMISGRGLGITGGTLDKLESIPGFKVLLPPERLVEQVQQIGVAIGGQTETMIPADAKLYALRDVTGTVPSIPLITASILSKKLAENITALVLDVKHGLAAFMAPIEQARQLAQSLVTLAAECGLPTRALLTDMNVPLGRAAGNWLEVREAVDCLENHGPADLRELVIAMGAHLLVLTRKAVDLTAARQTAQDCLTSGAPRRKWNEWLAAQNADLEVFHQKLAADHTAPVVQELRAARAGYVQSLNARIVGKIVRDLGAGRLTKDAPVHYEVGIDAMARPGEAVAAGALLAHVHATSCEAASMARAELEAAFDIGPAPPASRPLVAEVV